MTDLFPAWQGERFTVSDALDAELQRLFPSLNMLSVYENANSWLIQHPKRIIRRPRAFLLNWCRSANQNLAKQAEVQAELRVGQGPERNLQY